jgi:hypothetical protein
MEIGTTEYGIWNGKWHLSKKELENYLMQSLSKNYIDGFILGFRIKLFHSVTLSYWLMVIDVLSLIYF